MTKRVSFLGLEGHLAEGRERHPQLHWDFGHDRHWNHAAHRMAAEVVRNFLRTQGWVAANPAVPRSRKRK